MVLLRRGKTPPGAGRCPAPAHAQRAIIGRGEVRRPRSSATSTRQHAQLAVPVGRQAVTDAAQGKKPAAAAGVSERAAQPTSVRVYRSGGALAAVAPQLA